MKILISETNEIKTLIINDDPTDSILNDLKDVDDFMIIDDGRDDYQGGADFEMTQDNFTWWSDACAACNTANELLASYAQKYPANLLDAILDKHYNIGPFDSDGTDKIELVNKYFGNIVCVHVSYNSEQFTSHTKFIQLLEKYLSRYLVKSLYKI